MNIGKYYNLSKDIYINKIETNSKKVTKNNLFVCINGFDYDGHDFVEEAIFNGCNFIVSEKELNVKIPYVIVKDSRLELTRLLNYFYEYPLSDLDLIGITGTDGKTTTSFILFKMLNHFNILSGYIGTNGIYYEDDIIHTKNTTPGPLILYKNFSNYHKLNYKYVSMEVSSHAIDQKRIDGLNFKYGIFTNLSHDHLDYHKNIIDYFNTKLKLFKYCNKCIINIDDKFGYKLSKKFKSITFGKNPLSNFHITNIKCLKENTFFSFKYLNYEVNDVMINLANEYNVYNVIPSIIILLEEKINLKFILKYLKNIPKIDGRMEKINYFNNDIYIDFAHTPNALESLIKNIKKYNYNNIYLIFGCTGNRDKLKRPKMGVIASNYCDYVIFTEEDSYNEDPLDIINEMLINVNKNNYEIVLNRKEAILRGISLLNNNDCLLITGKGMESTLNRKNKIIIHNDYYIALNEVKRKKKL